MKEFTIVVQLVKRDYFTATVRANSEEEIDWDSVYEQQPSNAIDLEINDEEEPEITRVRDLDGSEC
jgi:hypothetical protein